MKNEMRDPFEDSIKKWKRRAKQIASLLSWIIHLFLFVGISALLTYYHINTIQKELHKKSVSVAESQIQSILK